MATNKLKIKNKKLSKEVKVLSATCDQLQIDSKAEEYEKCKSFDILIFNFLVLHENKQQKSIIQENEKTIDSLRRQV